MSDEALDRSIPESITPEQYFGSGTARLSIMPERRLMYAILLDAVLQLQRRDSVGAAEAERWIRCENDDWPCSFPNVCEALGIVPSSLARRLLDWRTSKQVMPLVGPTRLQRASQTRITAPRKRRRRPVERLARPRLVAAGG